MPSGVSDSDQAAAHGYCSWSDCGSAQRNQDALNAAWRSIAGARASHARLRKAAAGFASDGGANSFLDTLLESDKRFLKAGGECRPVFVVVSTDGALMVTVGDANWRSVNPGVVDAAIGAEMLRRDDAQQYTFPLSATWTTVTGQSLTMPGPAASRTRKW